MKYRVRYTRLVTYEGTIEAGSLDEAVRVWYEGDTPADEIEVYRNPEMLVWLNEEVREQHADADAVKTEKLTEENVRLREALAYYAHPEHYEPRTTFSGERPPGVLVEGGQKARDALNGPQCPCGSLDSYACSQTGCPLYAG